MRDGRVPLGLEADTPYAWRVDEVFADGSVLEGDVWTFRTAAAAGGRLLPGDCNLDGQVDLSDAICVLGLLFLGDQETPCGGSFTDASNTALLDWNGDGARGSCPKAPRRSTMAWNVRVPMAPTRAAEEPDAVSR